jgi:hypothetical protein
MEIAAEFTAAVVDTEPAFITKPVVAASVIPAFEKPVPEIVIA